MPLGVLFPDQSLNPRQHSKPELLFPAALQCQEAHELKECLYALEEQSALMRLFPGHTNVCSSKLLPDRDFSYLGECYKLHENVHILFGGMLFYIQEQVAIVICHYYWILFAICVKAKWD